MHFCTDSHGKFIYFSDFLSLYTISYMNSFLLSSTFVLLKLRRGASGAGAFKGSVWELQKPCFIRIRLQSGLIWASEPSSRCHPSWTPKANAHLPFCCHFQLGTCNNNFHTFTKVGPSMILNFCRFYTFLRALMP